jgi:hypothetical protein
MLRYLIVLLTVFLLDGCGVGTVSDPAYIIPTAGSVVKINRQLKIPGGQTRVFLQRGRVMAKAKFDRYYPSCNFEVWKLSQEPSVIQPDSFMVIKAGRDINQVVSLETLKVAALGWHRHDDDHAMIMHAVHIYLQSATQPNVYRLTCRGWLAVPAEAEKPTVADMREALGDYASISLYAR